MAGQAVLLLAAFALGCRADQRAGESPGRGPTSTLAASDSAGGRDSVRAELERYYRDFTARDWTAFADHFWRGATLTTVWMPPGEAGPRVVATTVPDFVRQAPLGPGSQPIFSERMLDAEVRVHGNLAHAWARYEARFGTPDSVAVWRGIDAFTLMAHGGRWRIVALAYTDE